MPRLMPDFILDNYAAGILSGEFPAATLFVDVSGFSAMTDALMKHGQHGAEVLAGVMRRTFEPLIRSVFEQKGYIAIQAGDAFTAIFPLEADPAGSGLRALAAAWNIQQRSAARLVHSTPYGEFPVTVKVGAAFGGVSWGILKSETGEQAAYYFRGPAIDSSTQAEHQAAPGQIILDPALAAQFREQISTQMLESRVLLTGIKEPLPEPVPVETRGQDVKIASRFLPAEVYSQRQTGEFRQVVYLFVSMGAAEERDEIDRFMQRVFALRTKYGGLLTTHFGDKGAHLLLIWGAPVAHENDVQRALNFVLDLYTETQGQVKAGMTYRIAHAGQIGSELAAQYAAFGRGANLAARFMEAAPAGSIWVDEYIADRVQALFDLDYVGCLDFKGFAVGHEVHLLKGRKESAQPFFTGDLIGRDQELARLEAFAAPIFRGQYAGVFVVRGEPGTGKSRLVYECVQHLGQVSHGGFLECLAQSDEILREGFNPFAYWLRHYFGLPGAASETENKVRFDSKLDHLIRDAGLPALADELERTRSCLAALLGLHWPDSLYEQLDAQGRYENTLISLVTLLQVVSLRQPVIMVLEDVQWLDAASLDLLSRLERTLTADASVQFPIAILATGRSGEANSALSGISRDVLDLGTLDRAGLVSLARAQLGGPVSDGLSSLLQVHSEGNPFFAEQILRYLQERGFLVQGADGWRVSPAYNRSPLPLDVSAVLIARLDRLAGEVREAVQTAAVLGREFEVRVLSHMLQSGSALGHASAGVEGVEAVISKAEQEAIWSVLDELHYIFRHALLRETAYQMQVQARRQELHAVAVQALETVYHDEIALHYAELAYHADHADLVVKACDYYERAGEAAAQAYQNIRAAEYFTRALELSPQGEQAAHYRLLTKRELIHEVSGNREAREADLAALQDLAGRMDDVEHQAYVWMRQARYYYDGGDFPRAIEAAQKSIDLANTINASGTAALAHGFAAQALYRSGNHDQAIGEIEMGLEAARASGDLLSESMLYNTLALIYLEQGKTSSAEEGFQQSLALARQTHDLQAQMRPLSNLALLAVARGDFLTAKRIYEDSLATWRTIGRRSFEENDLANLGWVAGNMGEYGRARDYLERQLRLAREIGDVYGETYGSINLSGQLAALGDYSSASQQAEQALILARRTGDRSGQAWALTYMGHNHFALGEPGRAASSYQQALGIRRELTQLVLGMEPLAGLARSALVVGDLTAAQRYTNEILDFLRESGSFDGTDDPLRIYYTCYLVLASVGDSRSQALLETAHAQLMERAGKFQDEGTRQAFLKNVEINRLIHNAWEPPSG